MRANGRAVAALVGVFVGLGLGGCGDDSGPPDVGTGDAMVGDSGLADSGLADSGLADSGLADSGLADSGLADSGLADGGGDASMDAGLADGGDDASMDGGPADGSMDADAEPPPEFDAPTASIAFPPPVSLTEADTLIVRGSAADVSRIAELRVDGVLATTTDDFLTWTASVPLTVGIHALEVTAEDEWGNAGVALASVEIERSDPWIDGSVELAYAAPDRAFIYNYRLSGRILEVNLTTGRRTVVGTGITRPLGLSFDTASAQLLYATADSVRSLDPTTGTVTVISDASVTSPIDFGTLQDAAFSATTAYVCGSDLDVVIAVDLTTGVRTEFSGSVGTGTAIASPEHIELDAPRSRLVLDNRPAAGQEFLAIDLADGSRTSLGGASGFRSGHALDSQGRAIYQVQTTTSDIRRFDAGTVTNIWAAVRPSLTRSLAGVYARTDDRLLITDATLGAITEIDLTMGTASFLSRPELRADEPIYGASRFAQLGEAVFFMDLSSAPGMARQLDRLDLPTRTRSEVSGVTIGSGSGWSLVGDVDISPSGDTAWVTGVRPGKLFEVDMATGARTTIITDSGGDVGARPNSLAVDAAAGVAYLLDTDSPNRILAITLSTGALAVLASDTAGTGHALDRCRDIELDGARLVLACRDGLTTVNVGTGARAQLAPLPGGTPALSFLSIDDTTGEIFVASTAVVSRVDDTGAFIEVFNGYTATFTTRSFQDFHYDGMLDRLTLIGQDLHGLFAVDVPTGEVVAIYR